MSPGRDPHPATDERIDALRDRLTGIQDRVKEAGKRRKRLFDEIASVELYLVRRSTK